MTKTPFILLFWLCLGAFPAAPFRVWASARADVFIRFPNPASSWSVRILNAESGKEPAVALTRFQPTLGYVSLAPGTYRIEFYRDGRYVFHETVVLEPDAQVLVPSEGTLTGHGAVAVQEDSPTSRTLLESLSTRHGIDTKTLASVPEPRRRFIQDLLAETVPGAVRSHDDVAHVRGAEMAVGYNLSGSSLLNATNPIFGIGPDPTIFRSLVVRTGAYGADVGWRYGGLLETAPRSGLGASNGFGNVQWGVGNHHTGSGRLAMGRGGRTWGLFGQFSLISTGEYFQPRARTVYHDQGRVWRGFLRGDWHPTEHLAVAANVFHHQADLEIPVDPSLETPLQQRHLRESGALLETDLLFGSWVTELRAGILEVRERHQLDGRPGEFITRRRNTTAMLDLAVSRYFGHAVKVEWGVQTRAVRLHEIGTFAEPENPSEDLLFIRTHFPGLHGPHLSPSLPAGRHEYRESGVLLGAYAQTVLRPWAWLKLNAGIRLDRIHLVDEASYWSPRVNVVIHPPGSPFSVLASYNRWVWAPPLENLLLSSRLPGASPVRSTTSDVYELGLRFAGRRWRIQTGAYIRRSRNVYHTMTLAPLDVYLFQNFDRENLFGWETSLVVEDLVPHLGLRVNYTLGWQDFSTPTTGGFGADPDEEPETFPAPMDQRHTVVLLIRWEPARFFKAGFSATWASGLPAHHHHGAMAEGMTMNPGAMGSRLPSYWLLNVSVGIRLFRRPETWLHVDGENLLNRVVPITVASVFTPTQYLASRKIVVFLNSAW